MGIPHKFDADKQLQLIEAYQSLKEAAGKDELILFIDAVYPRQSANLVTTGYGQGKKDH
ncbi:hypothetical protein [Xenorhabdus bovienii]|uniref:hypothetical protein n=1 Tax=Xenorhabdus bovienii TaxID=40576 RepID=UPI003DA266BF